MKIMCFDEKVIRDTYKGNKNILIIADYRCVNYEDDNNTIESKLSDALDIELYPICCNPIQLINSDFLHKYFSDYDYWFVSSSLFHNFS